MTESEGFARKFQTEILELTAIRVRVIDPRDIDYKHKLYNKCLQMPINEDGLGVKTRLRANPYENVFPLEGPLEVHFSCKSNSFSHKRYWTKTRFLGLHLGPVHTNPFSNENGTVLLRIRLSSTLQRRKRSPKTESFENALQSGAI